MISWLSFLSSIAMFRTIIESKRKPIRSKLLVIIEKFPFSSLKADFIEFFPLSLSSLFLCIFLLNLINSLIIKNNIRGEIVQINETVGFENFSLYNKRKSGYRDLKKMVKYAKIINKIDDGFIKINT